MTNVAAMGDLVPEGSYRVRVSQVEEKESANSGNPMVEFTFTIQDEGPSLGRTIKSWPSLQSHALNHLKSIYKACNYSPGPEGHDPAQCLDSEIYIGVVHGKRADTGDIAQSIPPYSYRPLTGQPWRPRR
jgi:hypothetical protein